MTLSRWFWRLTSRLMPATKHDVIESEKRLMKAVEDFAAAQTALLAKLGSAVDGVTGDVAGLKARIEELLASQDLTPEDKARLQGINDATQALADRLEALDAATPPVTP